MALKFCLSPDSLRHFENFSPKYNGVKTPSSSLRAVSVNALGAEHITGRLNITQSPRKVQITVSICLS